MLNGVPLPVVARLLGHSNVRMTMRYAHIGDREIEAAAGVIRSWQELAWATYVELPRLNEAVSRQN